MKRSFDYIAQLTEECMHLKNNIANADRIASSPDTYRAAMKQALTEKQQRLGKLVDARIASRNQMLQMRLF